MEVRWGERASAPLVASSEPNPFEHRLSPTRPPQSMDDTREREIGGQTVRIDRTLCIGSGNCTNLAPEIFVIRDDNIVDFQEDTPDIEEGRLQEAVSVCPVDALILEDENGEQIVP